MKRTATGELRRQTHAEIPVKVISTSSEQLFFNFACQGWWHCIGQKLTSVMIYISAYFLRLALVCIFASVLVASRCRTFVLRSVFIVLSLDFESCFYLLRSVFSRLHVIRTLVMHHADSNRCVRIFLNHHLSHDGGEAWCLVKSFLSSVNLACSFVLGYVLESCRFQLGFRAFVSVACTSLWRELRRANWDVKPMLKFQ